MNYGEKSLRLHEAAHGKIEITPTVSVENGEDLSVYYTPGVAAPCLAIAEDEKLASKYTAKPRTVAVVTDGSAILSRTV